LNACQKLSFKSEFVALESGQVVDKKSPLTSLSTFLDEQKILRANTRLTLSDTLSQDEVTPIILPKQNIVTEKLVLHLHINHHHIGVTYMQNILRAQYHLIGGRRELKRILRSCPNLRCKRLIPVKQIMAPLPKDRVTKADSFSVISIDYFGPLYYKVHLNDKAIEMKKLWVCVFSCLITRCLHLELVLDSSTEEFLNCFRLFVARRGLPHKIISDNFSSFKKADRELRLLFSKINWNKVNAHFVSKQIDWEFIHPHSPWLNGIAESAVKSTKLVLKKVIGQAKLTLRSLQVIIAEAELIVNCRPLTSTDDMVGLTPGELLYGRRLFGIPDAPNCENLDFGHLGVKRKPSYRAFGRNGLLLTCTA